MYLLLSVFIGGGSGFFIQLFLAKKLSVFDYGIYATTINLVNLISPIVAFGISGFLLRAYAQEGNYASRWMESVIKVLIVTSTLAFLVLQTWSFYRNGYEDYFYIYCLFFVYMISISFNSFTVIRYQIEENFKLLSLWQLMPKLLILVMLLSVLYFKSSNIKNVAVAYCLSSIIIITMSIFSLKLMRSSELKIKTGSKEAVSYQKASIRKLIKKSYPYGLSGFFYLVYYQSDILILSYFLDYVEVGYYSFALFFVTSVCLIPSVYFLSFKMKTIHTLAKNNRKLLACFYKSNIKYSLIFGLLFFIVFILCIKSFVMLIFGMKYQPSVSILYALGLYIPIKFLTLNSDSIMHTEGLVEDKVKVMAVAAVLNIVLNIVLIYLFRNTMGAVISTIITELFLLIVFREILKRKLVIL